MSASGALTLGKEERISSRKLIDTLFDGGHSHSMVAFPMRLVYIYKERESGCPPAELLVSVPKRCFKRAVKRNRVKRQVREAYRRHKHILWEALEMPASDVPSGNTGVALAFIWIDDKLYESAVVEKKMQSLLQRLAERIASPRKTESGK